MSLVRKLKDLWLFYFSEHAGDRPLFQAIQADSPKSILELGVGSLERSLKMIELAKRAGGPIHYTGVDLFEGRPAEMTAGVTLRQAYRDLRATGATVRLVPGDPFAALSRSANQISQVDLVMISCEQPEVSLAKAWYFLPRMLRDTARIFREEPAVGKQPKTLREMTRDELTELARPARRAA